MIEIARLQKVINGVTVLDIEALEVRPGEGVGLFDTHGPGPSELLALLTGRTRPTSGTVRVAGMDPAARQKELGRQVGVLFPHNALYENRSARGNLTFHCNLWGLPEARADEVLEGVGLVDHADMPAKKLSPSLARRLAFGRAILHRPPVLLLSHPFAGCDWSTVALLSRLISEALEARATVLILAAEPGGLASVCKAVYALENGRPVRTGAAPESAPVGLPFKVPARSEGEVVLVDLPDLLYASAEEGQTILHTVHGPLPSHLTLSELEERLAHNGFFRAHRAYLVNLQRIKRIIPYTRDSFTLSLDDADGSEIPLSKSAARALKELLGY